MDNVYALKNKLSLRFYQLIIGATDAAVCKELQRTWEAHNKIAPNNQIYVEEQALYKIGTFDVNTGTIETTAPVEIPLLLADEKLPVTESQPMEEAHKTDTPLPKAQSSVALTQEELSLLTKLKEAGLLKM